MIRIYTYYVYTIHLNAMVLLDHLYCFLAASPVLHVFVLVPRMFSWFGCIMYVMFLCQVSVSNAIFFCYFTVSSVFCFYTFAFYMVLWIIKPFKLGSNFYRWPWSLQRFLLDIIQFHIPSWYIFEAPCELSFRFNKYKVTVFNAGFIVLVALSFLFDLVILL